MDTNHEKKSEVKKTATPGAAVAKPEACATTAPKTDACSTTHKPEASAAPAKAGVVASAGHKPEACATTAKPAAAAGHNAEACSSSAKPGEATAAHKPDACATPAKPGAGASGEHKSEACTTGAKTEACANMHDGKVVSVSGKNLVMSSHEGKHYSHIVADDAKVCCDGKTCRAEDLKPGHKIRLTTKPEDNKIVVKIETLDKQADFAQSA